MKRLKNKCLECSAKAVSRSLCLIHYMRHKRAGTLEKFSRVYVPREKNVLICANGCIEWTGDINDSGYGIIQISASPRIRIRAHRYFYQKVHGEIPSGLMLLHTCDNRKCVNAAHLRVGTAADNARDAANKNRMALGRKHGSCKLTSKQVLAIRRSTLSHRALGNKYGVSHATIGEIKRGEIRTKEFM